MNSLGLVLVFSIAVTSIPGRNNLKGKRSLLASRLSLSWWGRHSEAAELVAIGTGGESSRVTLDQEAEVKGNLGLGLTSSNTPSDLLHQVSSIPKVSRTPASPGSTIERFVWQDQVWQDLEFSKRQASEHSCEG